MVALCGLGTGGAADERLDFSRDVRPILSSKCFSCHGPDSQNRDSEYRMDTEEGAFAEIDGRPAIVRGDPGKSEIIRRILSDDPDVLMPPPKHKRPLSEEEIATLTRWVEEGAPYSGHWAYQPVERPAVPEVKADAAGPVDAFIAAELEKEGLGFSSQAPPETLVRRLYLDLTGLPPTPAQVDEFLEDPEANFEPTIDRIMGTEVFAERMAMEWLDVARFADTNGYSIDDHRDMWVWRDWVIEAFRGNMPYDRFILEQMAGDLLENPTPRQLVATGFLRNSMNTHEGGTIPEEYRVAAIADKIDTVSTAFLGLTVKCAQCHDHKYDPVSMRDYYRFYAFFNTSTEPGYGATNGNTKPFVEVEPIVQDDAAWRESLERRIATLEHFKGHPEEVLRPDELNDDQIGKVRKSLDGEIGLLRKELKSGKTSAMVMDTGAADRKTHILDRGAYDQPTVEVTAGIPEIFGALPEGVPADRLALAKWLIDPSHPLTARVTVNRYWQMLFGTGIVKTAEDFGSQGEWPSHPELLDFLAAEFVASGWDVRALLKSMLLTRTYRQSSVVGRELLEKDPLNRLLARAPRFRLPAEMVRDNALAVAGLLNREVGGRSVYPPQPKGLWKEVSHFGYPGFFSAQHYFPDRGDEVYRRSFYTFWKRTSPPPVMTTFDAPNRETCAARRSATNTPLQALALMNAPQFVEASRGLAERMHAAGGSAAEWIDAGFRLATGRLPSELERDLLEEALESQRAYFGEDPQRARDYLGAAGASAGASDPVQAAALQTVASLILNLDETITRE
mgnify:CR=1 FL=1